MIEFKYLKKEEANQLETKQKTGKRTNRKICTIR